MSMPRWVFMQDAVLYGIVNHQGGPRGGNDFVAPNWWMGMATKTSGRHQLTFNAMLSLDPATVGRKGYREIFQVGEEFDNAALVDFQHPHDLFMQLSAVYRIAVAGTGLTFAAAPAGEPALGPVAFMHRASAAGLPFAPLGHHTFDATHISFGVLTAAIDRGRWTLEGSLFNGREPDDVRWNFDFGALDSVSARVWFRPSPSWELQASTGYLVEPEALEHGDIQRTTASVSWFRIAEPAPRAVTVGWGINDAAHGTRQALFGEFSYGVGRSSVFGRAEAVQVETALLQSGGLPIPHDAQALRDTVGAFTVGVDRELFARRGFSGTFGVAATAYAVPAALVPTHGAHPFSMQVFFRLKPPVGPMGRMWNMYMGRPMSNHAMPMPPAPKNDR
jgi:hypothetical protein